MEIALRCSTFTEEDCSAILSPPLGITLDRISNSSSMRDLGGKGGRDSMKVILQRTKMLDRRSIIDKENS